MSIPDNDQFELEGGQLPDCLTLWRCIGCGAMGNSEPCTGTCAFRKLEIASADEYAELLEGFATIAEQAERLAVVVQEIAVLGGSSNDHEHDYRSLQIRARETLRLVQQGESSRKLIVTPADEYATVWLCGTCGQIEAPQSCLGVCIRRNGEFLRADHYAELAARIEAQLRKAHELRSLVLQLAWVAPRAGQWEQACRAFQEKAVELLRSAQPSPDPTEDNRGGPVKSCGGSPNAGV
jgi:hypothetical protein